jgi:hypothetical protein
MTNNPTLTTAFDAPAVYEIRLQGKLGAQWRDWFGMMTITLAENGDTLLTGPVPDQAALYGLLRKVRDLGMPLLAVNRLLPGGAAWTGSLPDVRAQ